MSTIMSDRLWDQMSDRLWDHLMIRVRERRITMLEARRRKAVYWDLMNLGFTESKAYKRALSMHTAKLPDVVFGISPVEQVYKLCFPEIFEWAERMYMQTLALEFSIDTNDIRPIGLATETRREFKLRNRGVFRQEY